MKPVYPAMALAGVATTMLGPLLPGLAARGGWTDAQSGILFLAQFLASVVLSAGVGPLAARFGYRALMVAGLLLLTLGCAGCAMAAPPALPICVGVYGCGLGLFIPSANWAAAQANPGSSATPVMWINLCWSIGAVLAPLAIAALGSSFLWTLAAAALAMAMVLAPGARQPSAASQPRTPVAGIHSLTIVAAALLFFYTGTEAALGGWLSTYARRMPDAQGLWAVLPSIFWAGILMARVSTPVVLPRFSTRQLVIGGMLLALAGTTLLIAGQGPAPIVAATALAGVGMAPIFPLVVAQYADRTGGGAASGLLFAASGLGGAAIPPLVGLLAGATGSLRLGLAGLLLWIAIMIALEQKLGA